MLGEAALLLKELQQQRESQPGGAGLVRDQLPVAIDQRPTVDQLLGFPLATHERKPCPRVQRQARSESAHSAEILLGRVL